MSEASPLHVFVHKRLREVFGDPDNSLGRDDHWSLKPARPYAASINVLVNGTAETPAVWVFDPHAQNNGVLRAAVKDEGSLDAIIKQIQERVNRASLPVPPETAPAIA
jgi:hypothetical protein